MLVHMILFGGFIGLTVGEDALSTNAFSKNSEHKFDTWLDFWLTRLLINFLGYASVFLPGALCIYYVKRKNYLDKVGHGCVHWLIKLCVYGQDRDKPSLEEGPPLVSSGIDRSRCNPTIKLLICFFGLQTSYLIWGILQEKIMTQEYITVEGGSTERFRDSQFLVFVNRILAFALSGLYIVVVCQPKHLAPLYKYSYASFSNIMSSWCQYEALKFVSFPTETLAKASKILPVMVMGKIVSNKSYQFYEYATAFMITIGMSMFLLSRFDETKHQNSVTTFSGLIILIGYMVFDSFTSNWQGELFNQYNMSSVQMMCGVNFYSVLLTCISLWEQGGLINSLLFMSKYPKFVFDIMLLSVCSALGQFFIFHTIGQFGPVTFVIMMTIRQVLAILLSCIIYSHVIPLVGVIGVILVFVAVFLRIYCNKQAKLKKSQKTAIILDMKN